MEQKRLVDRFRVADADQSELEQLLLAHFGRSSGVSPSEVHYSHADGAEPALVVTYDGDGVLVTIESGPALRDQDVPEIEEKIERFLLTSTGVAIGQTILFAHLPTTGHFKYRDVFQIAPVPPEAPRLDTVIGDHPLLLQYAFSSSEDFQVSSLRRSRVSREIELLCVALTTSIWKSDGHMVRYHWVLHNDADPSKWKSEFRQGMYTYQGASGLAPAFAGTTETPAITLTPQAAYYHSVGISVGQVLDLPEDLDGLLDRFFKCPREDRDRFLRASFWFQHAQRVSSVSRSASFNALVSAIEALMPPAEAASQCRTCNKALGKGPTARFTDFVERFAPDPAVSRQDRRKLYSLRSALSHGGSLLHSDRHSWMGGMTSKALDEWSDQRAMWQIVRVALVNWIRGH